MVTGVQTLLFRSGLRDVAEGLGTPRSSAYALLQTLVARGWVETDPTGADYSIGIRALLAGTSYIDRENLKLAQKLPVFMFPKQAQEFCRLLSNADILWKTKADLVRNYIGRIRKESARLGVLVQEIIELSRLQEGDALVEPDDVDLDAVVAEAIDRVRTEAESKEVALVSGSTPFCFS